LYLASELARYALSEFERGIEDVTDDEAQVRLTKADGSKMNAISWIVAHIAWHWLRVGKQATQESEGDRSLFGANADPAPPPMKVALRRLNSAKASISWADDTGSDVLSRSGGWESVGTALMRVVLHTWFHIGEINAIRQMLGHDEIVYVGEMKGKLEWRTDA
jgi:hypothetical protein